MKSAVFLLAAVACIFEVCYGAATITTPPSNTSVLLGLNATMSCGLTGEQDLGQDLIWRRVTSDGAVFLSSNSVAVNASKHAVTDKYTLHIMDAFAGDEGEYQCSLFATSFSAYLTVEVAPMSASLLWPENRTYTEVNKAANLTCSADSSRPPATFRWYKGTTEVTSQAVHPTPSTDADGYGSSYSTLLQTPTSAEEGTLYMCLVDVPAKAGVFNKTLTLSFSGARHVAASLAVVMAAAIFSSFY